MQRFTILTFFSILFLFSCARDKFEEVPFVCPEDVTYENTIRDILVTTCGYEGEGCHHATEGSRADYGTYFGVKSDIDRPGDRNFFNVLIGESTATLMPPPFTPANRPQELTEEEFELIKCWMANDYKEK